LTGRPQVLRIGGRTSSTGITNTGTPQGCVLIPLLFSLFTHDCAATHCSNLIVKFADDTTIVGLITDSDESAYREEVDTLTTWCQDHNLSLNIIKTKKIIVDYRRWQEEEHAPLHINGSKVEKVSCFRFLGVNISNDLIWSAHTDKVVKEARKRLFFLKRLKKLGMDSVILTNFYRCTIESILTGCITMCYGSCTFFPMIHSRHFLTSHFTQFHFQLLFALPVILYYLGMHDTTFLQTDTSTSIFICVLADTEYRYRYFLDLVSMKVQLIWRQILFYPLQIMSSLWYKINRRLSQAKNKQSFLVLTHKKKPSNRQYHHIRQNANITR